MIIELSRTLLIDALYEAAQRQKELVAHETDNGAVDTTKGRQLQENGVMLGAAVLLLQRGATTIKVTS